MEEVFVMTATQVMMDSHRTVSLKATRMVFPNIIRLKPINLTEKELNAMARHGRLTGKLVTQG
jgi:hypothetical protein